jgi:hypothetical protein
MENNIRGLGFMRCQFRYFELFTINHLKLGYVLSMKMLFFFFIVFTNTINLNSAILYKIPVNLIQPDNSDFNCYVSGDEFHRILHTSSNKLIVLDSFGYYRISDTIVDDLANFYKYSSGLFDISNSFNQVGSKKNVDRFQGDTTKNNKEQLANIVIITRFADDAEYAISSSHYESMFNSIDGPSLYHYFKEVSYNQLDVISYIYPPAQNNQVVSFQDTRKRDFYRPFSSSNPIGYESNEDFQIRRKELLERIISYLDNVVPNHIKLDGNRVGYVDNLTIILKGGTDA